MTKKTVPVENFVGTLSVNVNNKDLSDKEFREFVANTLPIVGVTKIDWKLVSERLRCPICGDRASIDPETDGTRGRHSHNFEITREWALELSQPQYGE